MTSTAVPVVRLQRLNPDRDADLPLPTYMSAGAAGCDLVAALQEPLTIQAFERARVPTGLALAIPRGWEGQIRPRSGMAFSRGLGIPNAPGTIDSDYRGEVQVLVINLTPAPVTLVRGERIAQLVIAPVAQARFEVVHTLDATERGAGGFGSTGSGGAT
ncbi:MAG: dUTP diphosphatase [Myxococcota bacterium]